MERVDDALIGRHVGLTGEAERRGELHGESAVVRPQDGHVGVWLVPIEGVADLLERGAELRELFVDATGDETVRQHSAPVCFGSVVQRVPVPVLDHRRAAGDQRECGLGELAGVRREVHVRPANGLRVGLGDEEPRLLRREQAVCLSEQASHACGRPGAERGHVLHRIEAILHSVVRVARCDVEPLVELLVVERRARVRQTGHHELVVALVFAHQARLPGDELSRQAGLEATPGKVVLRESVPIGSP